MALVGSRQWTLKDSDFDGFLDDVLDEFRGESYTATLVGIRRIPLGRYKRYLKTFGAKPRPVAPLELSVMLHSDDEHSTRFDSPIYIEASQPFVRAKTLGNATVQLYQAEDRQYGTMTPSPADKERDITRRYLLPDTAVGGYRTCRIPKKFVSEHFDAFPKIADDPCAADIREYNLRRIEASERLYQSLASLFEPEGLAQYDTVDARDLPPAHRLPIFPLSELQGPNALENHYRHPLDKLATFAFGTDAAIRRRLTPRTVHTMHLAQMLLAIPIAGMSTSAWRALVETVPPEHILWTGLTVPVMMLPLFDGGYRIARSGDASRSAGLVGRGVDVMRSAYGRALSAPRRRLAGSCGSDAA